MTNKSARNKVLDLMPPVLVGWVIDSVRREPPDWIADLLGTFDPWNLAVFLAVLGVVIFFFESLARRRVLSEGIRIHEMESVTDCPS